MRLEFALLLIQHNYCIIPHSLYFINFDSFSQFCFELLGILNNFANSVHSINHSQLIINLIPILINSCVLTNNEYYKLLLKLHFQFCFFSRPVNVFIELQNEQFQKPLTPKRRGSWKHKEPTGREGESGQVKVKEF